MDRKTPTSAEAPRGSASDLLCAQLTAVIQSDEIAVGEKMPTEQALCARYGVGRSTVREALRTLQAKGLLEIRRGSGAYVVSKTEVGADDGTSWLSTNRDSISEFMEVRIAIEILAVKRFIISNRGDSSALDRIQTRFEAAVASNDIPLMAAMDEAFHQALGDHSTNSVLANLNKLIQKEFTQYRSITFAKEETRGDAVRAHRRILDAIRRQDTDDAVDAIRGHLTNSMENAVSGLDSARKPL